MRRLLFLVSAIVLVESTFFAVLAPLLPHYVDEFGLSKAEAGALSAVYAAGGLAGAIPSGLLAVRVGVKPTVLGGLAIITATSVAFGLAESAWVLYGARFGQGVGSALAWTGGLAWLIRAAGGERRGELIGIAMGAAVAGALLGPVLGGVASLTGPPVAFGAVALCGAVLAVWAWRMPAPAPGDEPQPLRALFAAFLEREIVSGFWLVSLAAFLLGVISVVAPLRLDELGWGALGISAAFLVSAGVEAALNPFLGRWSDRYGRLLPVRAGLFACIAVSVVLPWVDVRWPALLLVIAAGIAYGVFWVPGTALLSDGAHTAGLDQGFGFALLNVAWAPANVVGAGLGGALAGATGDAGPYLLVAALCLVTLAAAHRAALDGRPAAQTGSV
ncbi:MAG TPA: MFS transporter [Gaiellaceae bacterium]|nr:MFS transporter [Gaiellaceae bacterium]